MRTSKKYSMPYWPAYLRWTLGVALYLFAVIPVCVLGAFYNGVCAAWNGYLSSNYWRIMAGVPAVIVLGDVDKLPEERKRETVARLLHRKS